MLSRGGSVAVVPVGLSRDERITAYWSGDTVVGLARDEGVALTSGHGMDLKSGHGKMGRGRKPSERSGESGRGARLYSGSGRGTDGDCKSSAAHRHGDRNTFVPVAGRRNLADADVTGGDTAKPHPIYPSTPMVSEHVFTVCINRFCWSISM